MTENKQRFLFFDVLKILAIILVVLVHIPSMEHPNLSFLNFKNNLFGIENIIITHVGGWGVIIFLTVSGALIEYTNGSKLKNNFNYRNFIKKRLVRIYPAYWFSLVLAVVFNPELLNFPPVEYLKPLTGFNNYFSECIPINPPGWFIGLIITMYLLYPMLSKIMREYGFPSLFFIILLSYFIGMPFPDGDWGVKYWCPLTRLPAFALGIYMIQVGAYPRVETKSRTIRFLSDLSFPIFLTNYSLLKIFKILPDRYYINSICFIFAVFISSMIIYYFDISFRAAYYKYQNRKMKSQYTDIRHNESK
jgi:peptidoglycan/LPS O-acetylase OafA/YrhL